MRKVFVVFIGLTLGATSISLAQTSAVKENLTRHVYTLAADSMKGRGIGSVESRMAADYIIKQFEQNGVKPYGGSFIHPFSFKQGAVRAYGNNIIGVVEGSDPILKNEYIVVGGHYDHMGYDLKNGKVIPYNGADDNASGVATVIELGRLLALQPGKLKRSVLLIAFDGEESGLRGSTAMVNDSVIPLGKVKLMISVDMVGMLKTNKVLNLKGSATLDNGNAIFEALASRHGIVLSDLCVTVENRTDTSPFGRIGIPAISPTTGTLSPYHKPEDDANLLDYDGMTTITDFLAETVIQLSEKDQVVANSSFVNGAKKGGGHRFTAGAKVGLGISHQDYPDDFFQAKGLMTAQVGVYGKLRLFRKFYIQPEVQYETFASKTGLGNMRTHAVNTPCSILYALAGNDMFDSHVFLVLGGYHTYTFAGRVGGKNIDFDNQLNRTDYGLNYGILFDGMGYQFGFITKYGLTNVLPSGTAGNIRNMSVMMSFGRRF